MLATVKPWLPAPVSCQPRRTWPLGATGSLFFNDDIGSSHAGGGNTLTLEINLEINFIGNKCSTSFECAKAAVWGHSCHEKPHDSGQVGLSWPWQMFLLVLMQFSALCRERGRSCWLSWTKDTSSVFDLLSNNTLVYLYLLAGVKGAQSLGLLSVPSSVRRNNSRCISSS